MSYNDKGSQTLTINNLRLNLPYYEETKYSSKTMKVVKSYAANINQGPSK